MSDPSLAITTPEAPLWWISWYQPGDRFPPPTDGPLVERWPWPATLR